VFTAADVPKVTDWLQAWGSIGSAVLTGLAVVVAALALRKELRAWRAERADAEAADARLVWSEVVPEHDDDPNRTTVPMQWIVHNKSGGIVRDVVVQLKDESRPQRRKNEDSDSVVSCDLHVPHVPVISPGESVRGKGPMKIDQYTPLLLDYWTAEVTFTDRFGNRWSRLAHDQPTRSASRVLARHPFATASDYEDTPRQNRIRSLLREYCRIDDGIGSCRRKGALVHRWVVRLLQNGWRSATSRPFRRQKRWKS
jgi:hypothetical protein